MKDYVAVKMGKTPQGRRRWRLYATPRRGPVGPADALGDYDRLRKIRDILGFRGRAVTAQRIVRDQVAFRVT